LTSPFADFVEHLAETERCVLDRERTTKRIRALPNCARVAIVTGEGRANKEETDKHLFGPPG